MYTQADGDELVLSSTELSECIVNILLCSMPFSRNTRFHLAISSVSGSSGSTGTPGLLQAIPHIRFLKNDTASSTAAALFTILIATNIRDKVEAKKSPNSSLLRLTMSYSCTLPRYRSLRLWRFFELYNSAQVTPCNHKIKSSPSSTFCFRNSTVTNEILSLLILNPSRTMAPLMKPKQQTLSFFLSQIPRKVLGKQLDFIIFMKKLMNRGIGGEECLVDCAIAILISTNKCTHMMRRCRFCIAVRCLRVPTNGRWRFFEWGHSQGSINISIIDCVNYTW